MGLVLPRNAHAWSCTASLMGMVGTGGGLAHSLLILDGLCCACSSFYLFFIMCFFSVLFSSTCFVISQQGEDMSFTTLQAPVMLL